MNFSDLTFALGEEIGNPELFTGRREELAYLLDWTAMVKNSLGDSQVILARRRRGKTSLVQRYYNILYTRNDPKPVGAQVVDAFLELKQKATPQLVRPTLFMILSHRGFAKDQAERLAANGILACTTELLETCAMAK